MRKTNEQKAITLIALIITIVVLLILAVVAINAVTGDGIIGHATNAKTEYQKATNNETDMINHYEKYLKTEGKIITFKIDGEIYYAERDMTWLEWIDSEYNTINARNEQYFGICFYNPRYQYYDCCIDDTRIDKKIVSGKNYTCTQIEE